VHVHKYPGTVEFKTFCIVMLNFSSKYSAKRETNVDTILPVELSAKKSPYLFLKHYPCFLRQDSHTGGYFQSCLWLFSELSVLLLGRICSWIVGTAFHSFVYFT
jgi:hypothetical protein